MESNVDFTQYLDQHSGQVTHDEQLLYMMKTEPSSPPKWDWRKKTVKSRIMAQQNTALIHYVCVNLSVCHSRDISAFLHCVRFSTIQILYFWKGNGTRTSKTMFPSFSHANTETKLHKYTNTVWIIFADRHQHVLYFWWKGVHRRWCDEDDALNVIKKYHNKAKANKSSFEFWDTGELLWKQKNFS